MVRRNASASGVQIPPEPAVAIVSRFRRRGGRAQRARFTGGFRRTGPLNAADVTVLVLTHNEERHIQRAFRSAPTGMQRLVVDAQSNDRTVEVAKQLGARTIVRAWTDFVDARRFAISQVMTPWVLMLDADEVIDRELAHAIATCDGSEAGYIVFRTTYFCGKPMRLWESEPLIRLFRRECATLESSPTVGNASLHEHVLVRGSVGRLDGVLRHYSYPTVRSYCEKFLRYTKIEADSASKSVPRALFHTAVLPLRLVRSLFARGAVRDGWRGTFVAAGSSLYPAVVAWRAVLR